MDDSDIRMHVWPRLTAVCQDAAALGYEAAMWLSRHIEQGARTGTCARTTGTIFEVNGTTTVAPGHALGVAGQPPESQAKKPRRKPAPRS